MATGKQKKVEKEVEKQLEEEVKRKPGRPRKTETEEGAGSEESVKKAD
jgi:hypothetical protein